MCVCACVCVCVCDEPKQLNQPTSNITLCRGDFGAAAVMITYGAVIGKTSPLQLVGILFFELFFYTMNEYIGISYLECQDVGGSMIIHAFGAYFGVAVALVLGRRSVAL